jgi:transcriptional regulator with XRE-family HTH domain
MGASPVLSRRSLGSELRRLRESAKVPVSRAAEELDCSPSKISRIETGVSAPRRPEIDVLLRLYGPAARRMREELLQLAAEGKQSSWYDEYKDLLAPGSTLHRFIGLESGATLLRSYSPGAVPGLLQTEGYARAVIAASQPGVSAAELDNLIRLRMARKGVLSRKPHPLRVSALLDESVVRRPAYGPGVMRQQIDHLIEVVDAASPDLDLRLLPFSAGLHGLLGSMFSILSFDRPDEDVIFFEGQAGGVFEERPEVVRSHAERLDSAWKQSLGGHELMVFLREVADTHE